MAETKENLMRRIKVEKITLNMSMGATPEHIIKATKLLEAITGKKPVKTKAKKRIPTWNLRPGMEIGAKITLRGQKAVELLKKLLEAVELKIAKASFTSNGFSFGIKEYIDIRGIKYDPTLGMLGLDVCVTLERPGFRIKRRKLYRRSVPSSHQIIASDAAEFAQKELGVKIA